MAAGAHRAGSVPDGAVRSAGAVLLLLLHGLRRALAGPGGHPPDVAGQDPRRPVGGGAGLCIFRGLGRLLHGVGAYLVLRGNDPVRPAVSVRLCRPVQGGHHYPGHRHRPGAAAFMARPARAGGMAVAHRQGPPAGVENGAGGAGHRRGGVPALCQRLLPRAVQYLFGAEDRGAADPSGGGAEPADTGEERAAAGGGRSDHTGGHPPPVRRVPAVRTGHEPPCRSRCAPSG